MCWGSMSVPTHQWCPGLPGHPAGSLQPAQHAERVPFPSLQVGNASRVELRVTEEWAPLALSQQDFPLSRS